MSDTKVNLRKIVGLEEAINKLSRQPDRERVLGDKGVNWLNGYGENGKEPTEDEKEEAAKKDPGKGWSKNLDDKKDASDPIEIGDDVGDMGELKDCSSGRCVNVRLHGKAPPPDGWSGVCTPPPNPETQYYYRVRAAKSYWVGGYPVDRIDDVDYRTRDQAASALSSFMGQYYSRYPHKAPHTGFDEDKQDNKVVSKLIDAGLNYFDINLSWRVTDKVPSGFKYNVLYIYVNFSRRPCTDGNAICQKPPTEQWPQDTCSEVVAGAAGFKGACPAHDPNLPPQFAEAKGEITLCDKDGNEVKFTKTDEGYEVYQAKYRRTAVVDPNTFKVVKFK